MNGIGWYLKKGQDVKDLQAESLRAKEARLRDMFDSTPTKEDALDVLISYAKDSYPVDKELVDGCIRARWRGTR